MPKKRVVIDIGHGKNTYPPSKGVPEMAEFEFNNAVGKLAKSMLESQGFEVLLSQPFDSKDVPLNNRIKYINDEHNKSKVDCIVSIHADYSSNSDAEGHWVFYWHSSKQSSRLATIWDKHGKELPNRSRGILESKIGLWTNFGILRDTKPPAILAEHGFMSNKNDLKLLLSNNFRKQCAIAITKTVCEYCGVAYKDLDTNPVIKGGLYRVRKSWDDSKSQIGAYTILNNAKEFSDNNKGYNVYDESGKLVYPIKEVTMQLTYSRLLRQGSKGEDVRKLQTRLTEIGFDTNGVDGIFGRNTRTAVEHFQSYGRLKVDGLVGRATIQALNSFSKGIKVSKYEILRPDNQTTIVKIPHKNIKNIKTIIANNNSKSETLQSMKNRTGVDLIINGGIYYWSNLTKQNHSLNLLVKNGKTIVAGSYSRYSLMTEKNGSYRIGMYNWNIDRMDALGGSPALVINGKVNLDRGTLGNDIHNSKHPRSAIGMCKDYFYMVVIDGRKPSAKLYGMTNLELANFMLKELKCEYAIGFDGGWSSTVIGNEGVLNKSYTGRKIHNAVGVVLV